MLLAGSLQRDVAAAAVLGGTAVRGQWATGSCHCHFFVFRRGTACDLSWHGV